MKISEQYIAIENMKLHLMKSNYLENFQSANFALETIGKEFPMEKDVMGSLKGMLTLCFTYKFEITSMVLNGSLSFVDSNEIHKNIASYEKLDILDLENLALVAINNKQYDVAIDFTRAILQLVPKVITSLDEKVFFRRITKMKNELIQMNNGYLQKKRSFIGKKWPSKFNTLPNA